VLPLATLQVGFPEVRFFFPLLFFSCSFGLITSRDETSPGFKVFDPSDAC